jgi:hypothetical protein
MSPVSSNGAPRAGAAKWEEYLQFCNEHALANWWFRGVTDSTYSLLPKIGRGHEREKWTVPVGKSTRATPEDRERRVFEAFRRRAHLELQVRPESDLEWLALAQHHGVPTRLLDWTTNPLMAAWFATDKSDPPDDRIARVHAVRVTSKLAVENVALDPFKMTGRSPVFVVAPHWHPRVRAQRGCFSVHPVPNEALGHQARSLRYRCHSLARISAQAFLLWSRCVNSDGRFIRPWSGFGLAIQALHRNR